VGRDGVGLGAGAATPMKRYVVSKEKWLRCWGGGDHFDMVQSRISEVSRMSTTPKGTGWKTPVVTRVSVVSMVPRVSVMSEGMPDKIVGLDQHEKSKCASRISTMLKRRGVVDVYGAAGANDFDVAAGVKGVRRVHGGGRGALRRWRS